VLPWWEGADEAQSRCGFSNLIRYDLKLPVSGPNGSGPGLWPQPGSPVLSGSLVLSAERDMVDQDLREAAKDSRVPAGVAVVSDSDAESARAPRRARAQGKCSTISFAGNS
jgi:hypothetical protein